MLRTNMLLDRELEHAAEREDAVERNRPVPPQRDGGTAVATCRRPVCVELFSVA